MEVNPKEQLLNHFFSDLLNKEDEGAQQTPNESSSLLLTQCFMNYVKKNKLTIVEKKVGMIQGLSAFTYKNQKSQNEDKMGININYSIEKHNVSFYSIYDGHGGQETADTLKENLHQEIMQTKKIITDINTAILTGFNKIEEKVITNFLKEQSNQNSDTKQISSSGSCALLLIAVDDKIHIANVGDSRAIISLEQGKQIASLSVDHKPMNEGEKQRILGNGGEIRPPPNYVNSVFRVFPGGLAISRSIGDVESKYPQFGGRTGGVISTPDIVSINYKNTFDFILLACDGIFDKLSNKDISLIVFSTLKNEVVNSKPYNKFLNKVTVNIMKEAIIKGSKDNLSCIFLCCDSIMEMFNKKDLNQINEAISAVTNTTIQILYIETITMRCFFLLQRRICQE